LNVPGELQIAGELLVYSPANGNSGARAYDEEPVKERCRTPHE